MAVPAYRLLQACSLGLRSAVQSRATDCHASPIKWGVRGVVLENWVWFSGNGCGNSLFWFLDPPLTLELRSAVQSWQITLQCVPARLLGVWLGKWVWLSWNGCGKPPSSYSWISPEQDDHQWMYQCRLDFLIIITVPFHHIPSTVKSKNYLKFIGPFP